MDNALAWLLDRLECPRDHGRLRQEAGALRCSQGHVYPVVDGIPVMIVQEKAPTQEVALLSAQEAVEALGGSGAKAGSVDPHRIDPFVQKVIAATGGNMYKAVIDRLPVYPIPELPLPPGEGKTFLDMGCNWGRWCLSAARQRYTVVGIDHNLQALIAAKRVARQLGVRAHYVAADSRYMPFTADCFDVVFSYSVLQHFSKADAYLCLREAARLLVPSGTCLVQMPNTFGIRNLYHQIKRGFRQAKDFEVRYWKPGELRRGFTDTIGATSLSVDGFFSLNAQASCSEFLPFFYRYLIAFSDMLRRLSQRCKPLTYCADSLYVKSIKP